MIATQDRAMDGIDPGDVFHVVYHSNAGSNYAQLSDPKLDDLIDRAAKETNKDKRKQLYHELQRYLLTSGTTGAVPVGWVEGLLLPRQEGPGLQARPHHLRRQHLHEDLAGAVA